MWGLHDLNGPRPAQCWLAPHGSVGSGAFLGGLFGLTCAGGRGNVRAGSGARAGLAFRLELTLVALGGLASTSGAGGAGLASCAGAACVTEGTGSGTSALVAGDEAPAGPLAAARQKATPPTTTATAARPANAATRRRAPLPFSTAVLPQEA